MRIHGLNRIYKYSSQNRKISILVVGIFLLFLSGIITAALHDRFSSMSGIAENTRSHISVNISSGIVCNISVPYDRSPGWEEFFRLHISSLFPVSSRASSIVSASGMIEPQVCSGVVFDPVFLSGGAFSGWISSGSLRIAQDTYTLDIALDSHLSPIFPDRSFTGSITENQDTLSPYLGTNIQEALRKKIDILRQSGRILAPSESVRVAYLRAPVSVSWPSAWREISWVRQRDGVWRISLVKDLSQRYASLSLSGISSTEIGSSIALTFDDGPHPIYTPEILDILARYKVKASFCVLGSQAKKYPDIIRRIVREGHEICNHSYTHRNFTQSSLPDIQSEIVGTDRIIAEILSRDSYHSAFVRPPYGSISREMEQELNTPFALWSIDTLDWGDKRPSAISRRAFGAKDGDIILFHDIHPGAAQMLSAFIDSYQMRGYKFDTLSQLAASYDLSVISGKSFLSKSRVRFLRDHSR